MPNDSGATQKDPDVISRIRFLLPEFSRGDGTYNIRGLAAAAGISRAGI